METSYNRTKLRSLTEKLKFNNPTHINATVVATPWNLIWELHILLLLLLAKKLLVSWCIKCIFRYRDHTNPVLVPPTVPHEGLEEDQTCVKGLIIPMSRLDERISPIMDHACRQNCCEGLIGFVKVNKNCVAAPPKNEHNCVGVNLG